MKNLTILVLCIACAGLSAVVFAQEPAKTGEKPEISVTTKKADQGKPSMVAGALQEDGSKPLMLGSEVKTDRVIPVEKVASKIENHIGKEFVLEGLVSEVDTNGAWRKLSEKSQLEVLCGSDWVFPQEAKGMTAKVHVTIEKKEKISVQAKGAILTKADEIAEVQLGSGKNKPKQGNVSTGIQPKKEQAHKSSADTE